MEAETGRHARILALAATKLRRSSSEDEEVQDRLSLIAARLEGLAERLLDEV